MSIVSIALLIVPPLLGTAVLAQWRLLSEKVALVAVGTTVGLVGFATIAYPITWLTGRSSLVLWSLVVVMVVATGLLARRNWSWWRGIRLDRSSLIVAVIMLGFAGLLGSRLLFVTEQGLATAVLNAWGDLGWHVSNITLFAEGQSLFPGNPILAGEQLTYPFLINFYSGLLVAGGSSLVFAIVAPAVVLLTVLFTLFFVIARATTNSQLAGVLALVLLIGSGGALGWLQLAEEVQTTGTDIVHLLTHLPRDFTGSGGDENGFHFLNVILAALLPQRSFLFGLPLALTIIAFILMGRQHTSTKHFIAAGIVAGLLPLAHAHSVIALIPLILIIAANQLWRAEGAWRPVAEHWVSFIVAALVVGLPGVSYYLTGGTDLRGSFFRLQPGWTAGELNWFWFWFQNTGLLVPLGALSLLLSGPRWPKLLAGGGLVLFVISNLWLFAPWPWDNYKLLIYWLVFSLPSIGYLAAQAITQWPNRKPYLTIWLPALTILLLILHVQTAALDLWKTALPTAGPWQEWSNADIAFAQRIAAITKPGDVIVTAPYHNNPVALAGRQVYLGFPGHVWSHGNSQYERESAVNAFYQGQLSQLPEVAPQFVVVGPVERSRWPNLAIAPNWQLVEQSGPHQLYRIR